MKTKQLGSLFRTLGMSGVFKHLTDHFLMTTYSNNINLDPR